MAKKSSILRGPLLSEESFPPLSGIGRVTSHQEGPDGAKVGRLGISLNRLLLGRPVQHPALTAKKAPTDVPPLQWKIEETEEVYEFPFLGKGMSRAVFEVDENWVLK